MSHVFISHVNEDAPVALEIALRLEEARYPTWTYEIDSVPGLSYLLQTKQAIENSTVFVLLVSHAALESPQLSLELVRAHEARKRILPICWHISDEEYKRAQPEWKQVVGSATSIALDPEDHDRFVDRLVRGVQLLGLHSGTETEEHRIRALRREIYRLQHPEEGAARTVAQPSTTAPIPDVSPPARANPTRAWGWRSLAAIVALFAVLGLGWAYRQWPIGPVTVQVMGIVATPGPASDVSSQVLQAIDVALFAFPEIKVVSEADYKKYPDTVGKDTRVISGDLRKVEPGFLLRLKIALRGTAEFVRGGAITMRTDERLPLAELASTSAIRVVEALMARPLTADERERLVFDINRPPKETTRSGFIDGIQNEPEPDRAPDAGAPPSETGGSPGAWNPLAPRSAYAADEEDAVRALLDAFGAALQAKDLNGVLSLYVEPNDAMRSSLASYFKASVDGDLQVRISDVTIALDGGEGVASFTRTDDLTERETGRRLHLAARLDATMVRTETGWKIRKMRKA